jgi:hypothetical protein
MPPDEQDAAGKDGESDERGRGYEGSGHDPKL